MTEDKASENRDYGTVTREDASETSVETTQEGVKAIEAVSMTWTKWGLFVAYTR